MKKISWWMLMSVLIVCSCAVVDRPIIGYTASTRLPNYFESDHVSVCQFNHGRLEEETNILGRMRGWRIGRTPEWVVEVKFHHGEISQFVVPMRKIFVEANCSDVYIERHPIMYRVRGGVRK